MILHPIIESEASGIAKDYYEKIKKSLGIPNLPLFFQYLGPFPEFLEYLGKQILKNLDDLHFQNMAEEYASQSKKSIAAKIGKSTLILEWLENYKHLPEFYHFNHDLEKIYLVNIKLAIIFLSIREAVKGWAIASRKLQGKREEKNTHDSYSKDASVFIFEVSDTIIENFIKENKAKSLALQGNQLARRENSGLAKNLLPDYLEACRLDFDRKMKTEEYLMFRVQVEQHTLNNLHNLPHPIFCPINVVIGLTGKYPSYPEILYLLSEHFPTYAVQRMLFSGFLLFE